MLPRKVERRNWIGEVHRVNVVQTRLCYTTKILQGLDGLIVRLNDLLYLQTIYQSLNGLSTAYLISINTSLLD